MQRSESLYCFILTFLLTLNCYAGKVETPQHFGKIIEKDGKRAVLIEYKKAGFRNLENDECKLQKDDPVYGKIVQKVIQKLNFRKGISSRQKILGDCLNNNNITPKMRESCEKSLKELTFNYVPCEELRSIDSETLQEYYRACDTPKGILIPAFLFKKDEPILSNLHETEVFDIEGEIKYKRVVIENNGENSEYFNIQEKSKISCAKEEDCKDKDYVGENPCFFSISINLNGKNKELFPGDYIKDETQAVRFNMSYVFKQSNGESSGYSDIEIFYLDRFSDEEKSKISGYLENKLENEKSDRKKEGEKAENYSANIIIILIGLMLLGIIGRKIFMRY